MDVRLVVDCQNHHGEGVFWNPADGLVWWTDIEGKHLWSFDPESNHSSSYSVEDRVCCFAPRLNGGFIAAYADHVALLDVIAGTSNKIFEFEPTNDETRTNDGRTDRQGRFVIGGMNEKSGSANSSVIRIDADLSFTTLINDVSCANSTCFSPDGETMYFADTPDKEIVAFDYDTAAGTISNRRQLASFSGEPGLPDGSCVDAEGGVWNAEWEGRRVVRVAPNGKIDRIIEVPVWKPTCCAFGGANLDTLYITTSRLMSDEEMLSKEPQSGGLFAVEPGVCGVIDAPFAG